MCIFSLALADLVFSKEILKIRPWSLANPVDTVQHRWNDEAGAMPHSPRFNIPSAVSTSPCGWHPQGLVDTARATGQ